MTDPIRKSTTVPLSPDQAFRLFTDDLSKWWPVESHSISAANGELPKDVTVEKHVGGHIVETKADGEAARWGTVTHWTPGSAVGISWHVGRDEDEATDIMVTFTAVEMGTRVDLTHSGFDRLGETAMALHGQYRQGWQLVLGQCFSGYCVTLEAAI